MGIRFLCSSCQRRLNVKAKQAGQFCICPECENEIQIPAESTILPLKKKRKKRRRAKVRSIVEVDLGPVPPQPDSGKLEANDDAVPSPANSADAMKSSAAENVTSPSIDLAPVEKLGSSTVSESVEVPRVGESAEQESATTNNPLLAEPLSPVGQPDLVGDSESSVIEPKPISPAAFDELISGESNSDSEESSEVESFLLAKPAVKIGDHPLKSNPNLVWYLRHKRLGEKGPLKAKQLETMLELGQLRAGFIVWREDWNDWVPAEKVFPELSEKPTESTYEIPDELNPHSEVSRKRRAQKRFWMCFSAAAILIVIVLVYWIAQFFR